MTTCRHCGRLITREGHPADWWYHVGALVPCFPSEPRPGRGSIWAEPASDLPPGLPWRVGRSVGRTLYDADDHLIGVMDTPELAARVVEAVNRADE
jgi:hypothetical protein